MSVGSTKVSALDEETPKKTLMKEEIGDQKPSLFKMDHDKMSVGSGSTKVSALDEETPKQTLMKEEIGDQKPSLFKMDHDKMSVGSTKISALDEETPKQTLMKEEIGDQKPSLFKMDHDKMSVGSTKVSALDEETPKQTLMKEEIGDQKPTLFKMDLQEIGDSKVLEETLKSIWVDKLPSHIMNVIKCLDILAELADKLYEIKSPAENDMTLIESSINIVTEKLSNLSEQVKRLTTEAQESKQTVSISRSRCNSLSQTSSCSKSPSKGEKSDTETPIIEPH